MAYVSPAQLYVNLAHYSKEIRKQAQKRKFQHQYHSVHTSYSRGVAVLVKRGVMFTCKQISIDEEGRYVFLYCVIENREYVLANIYIPPPFKLEVMYKLMDFMMDKTGIPVIVMGDFNEVINKKLDRFPRESVQNASESVVSVLTGSRAI